MNETSQEEQDLAARVEIAVRNMLRTVEAIEARLAWRAENPLARPVAIAQLVGRAATTISSSVGETPEAGAVRRLVTVSELLAVFGRADQLPEAIQAADNHDDEMREHGDRVAALVGEDAR